MGAERLQKVLARAGVASRRGAEVLIRGGRVRVDGRVVESLGLTVDPARERVEVDGRPIAPEPLAYLLLNKPAGMVTTVRDPQGRPTVAERVRSVGVRVVPVGRLDFHTSGVLLLTNDGELAARLGHPSSGVAKEYLALVRGRGEARALARWRESIAIDGKWTRPAEVHRVRVEGDRTWLSITLHEGRNRQIRRLGEHAGQPVLRLERVAFAGLRCDDLARGEWRHLTATEVRQLRSRVGATPPGSATSSGRERGCGRRPGT